MGKENGKERIPLSVLTEKSVISVDLEKYTFEGHLAQEEFKEVFLPLVLFMRELMNKGQSIPAVRVAEIAKEASNIFRFEADKLDSIAVLIRKSNGNGHEKKADVSKKGVIY